MAVKHTEKEVAIVPSVAAVPVGGGVPKEPHNLQILQISRQIQQARVCEGVTCLKITTTRTHVVPFLVFIYLTVETIGILNGTRLSPTRLPFSLIFFS